MLQKVFANDCSRSVMCRMDGEGAGKRERLVTDAVSRWEVLRKCRGGGVGSTGAKEQCGDPWVGPEVTAPTRGVVLWRTRGSKMAKELARCRRPWEFTGVKFHLTHGLDVSLEHPGRLEKPTQRPPEGLAHLQAPAKRQVPR